MHVDDGQREAKGFPQHAEGRRGGRPKSEPPETATKTAFAATKHSVTANGVLDAGRRD